MMIAHFAWCPASELDHLGIGVRFPERTEVFRL